MKDLKRKANKETAAKFIEQVRILQAKEFTDMRILFGTRLLDMPVGQVLDAIGAQYLGSGLDLSQAQLVPMSDQAVPDGRYLLANFPKDSPPNYTNMAGQGVTDASWTEKIRVGGPDTSIDIESIDAGLFYESSDPAIDILQANKPSFEDMFALLPETARFAYELCIRPADKGFYWIEGREIDQPTLKQVDLRNRLIENLAGL